MTSPRRALLLLVLVAVAPELVAAGPPAGAAMDTEAESRRVRELPLIEVPARGPHTEWLAVLLSGDGGWVKADQGLSAELAERGIAVAGWSSPRYFRHRRDPDAAAADLAALLHRFLPAWRRSRVLLLGYSFGADVMPFLARRLPADLADRVDLVALLGPSPYTDFEFHPTDWIFHGRHHPGERAVEPEIAALRGLPLLCSYGEEEMGSLCRRLPPGRATLVVHPGRHILHAGFAELADAIVRAAGAGKTSRLTPVFGRKSSL
jgi:type IV secretory pathway VirJ component